MSQASKSRVADPSLSPAAVLVLVYLKDGEYCILLNKRSDTVAEHKGEIAFPGGRKEIGDTTLRETALRETFEEMGVRPQDVEVLGELDDVATSSSYVIAPFVGTIPHPYPFVPDEREVAAVLEVPLKALDDPINIRQEARVENGQLAHETAYAYGGHLIFGATAKVLHRFLSLLSPSATKSN